MRAIALTGLGLGGILRCGTGSAYAFNDRAGLHGGWVAAGFAIDVDDGKGPEGDKIDPRYELAHKGWQELPLPAEEVEEDPGQAEIEHIVDGGFRAGDEEWEDDHLKDVRGDGERCGGDKTRFARAGAWVFQDGPSFQDNVGDVGSVSGMVGCGWAGAVALALFNSKAQAVETVKDRTSLEPGGRSTLLGGN